MVEIRPYESAPRYAPLGRSVCSGWADPAATLPAAPTVLALDGPAVLDWDAVVTGLAKALARRGTPVGTLDVRNHLAPWGEILRRTASPELPDDPDFATLASGRLADLFDDMPHVAAPTDGVLVVFGPGAALVHHEVLWYADLPKRYAEAAVSAGTGRNLGQPPGAGPGTTKRLFYIDWPLLDRHRDAIAADLDRWIDTQDPDTPASLNGATLRATLAQLAGQPFRTRPTFNSTSWGGHWAQRRLGFNPQAPSTALGYELIAPESGVLLGADSSPAVEVPFQLIVSLHPERLLGEAVHATFGTSFPVRFDYLDTFDGGSLSVHCHPRAEYMRRVFGWSYTQQESYYVMVASDNSKIFLGLRDHVDIDAFHRDAQNARRQRRPFDIERYVQNFPAQPHQLFLIPAGTPHGSGEGNVVLEISATPYLYSLRFYDWLRHDHHGNQRPVHIEHAFANLDAQRAGQAVTRDLVQTPRTLRAGDGWREELLGRLPDMFFDVRRIVFDANGIAAEDDSHGAFHVLNLVDGDGVMIETTSGHQHALVYAETLLVPASVGGYTLRRLGSGRVRLVKAVVR